MSRKPVFRAAFAAVSLACDAFAVVNFPRAYPIVEFDLEMDRPAALAEARRRRRARMGPSDYPPGRELPGRRPRLQP